MNSSTIESPCVGICALNEEDICTGCYRSRDDITVWSRATDSERARILESVKVRVTEANLALLNAHKNQS